MIDGDPPSELSSFCCTSHFISLKMKHFVPESAGIIPSHSSKFTDYVLSLIHLGALSSRPSIVISRTPRPPKSKHSFPRTRSLQKSPLLPIKLLHTVHERGCEKWVFSKWKKGSHKPDNQIPAGDFESAAGNQCPIKSHHTQNSNGKISPSTGD